MKICTGCKIDKPKTDYYKDSRGADGLCAKCKICKAAKSKLHYKANKEATKQKSRDYYTKHAEQERERSKLYYQANPEKAKTRRYTRLARMKDATPIWFDNNYIKDLYANKIEANKIMADVGVKIVFEVDHIEPIANDEVCGLHCEFNLQVLTAEENRAKHTNRVEGVAA